MTSQQVLLVSQFVYDTSSNVRFAERGIFRYAAKSVEMDIELPEDIREACHGMDAFESVMAMDVRSDSQRVAVLVAFLMQTLERMAKRLEVFYTKLAQYKVYEPSLECNPARSRWELVRRRVRDGSFFILTQQAVLGAAPAYVAAHNRGSSVNFDGVMNSIQASIRGAPRPSPTPTRLNAVHLARATTPPTDTSAMATHENNKSVRAMSAFIDENMGSIRRLSRMPSMPLTFEQIREAVERQDMLHGRRTPSPPSSHGSVNGTVNSHATSLERLLAAQNGKVLNTRTSSPMHGRLASRQGIRSPPTPPPDHAAALGSMMGKLNVRSRGSPGVAGNVGCE